MTIFDDFGEFVSDGVKVITTPIGEAFDVGGTLVIDGINNIGIGFRELIRGAMGIRRLKPLEISLAQEVFGNTLPYSRILVCSLNGVGGKPFTLPGNLLIGAEAMVPGIGTLLAVASIAGSLWDKYILFLGEEGYNNAPATDTPRKMAGQQFLHELTHVWQGDVGAFQWAYVGDSITQRCLHAFSDDSPYDYTPGKNWNEYHAEQQANIVDDFWRKTKMMTEEPTKHQLYPYIRDNILRRNPNAPYVPPPATGLTIEQLVQILAQLRAQRAALLPYGNNIAAVMQMQVLDAEIAAFQGAVATLAANGHRVIAHPTVNPAPPTRVIAKPTIQSEELTVGLAKRSPRNTGERK